MKRNPTTNKQTTVQPAADVLLYIAPIQKFPIYRFQQLPKRINILRVVVTLHSAWIARHF
jgi:hypothetical protein